MPEALLRHVRGSITQIRHFRVRMTSRRVDFKALDTLAQALQDLPPWQPFTPRQIRKALLSRSIRGKRGQLSWVILQVDGKDHVGMLEQSQLLQEGDQIELWLDSQDSLSPFLQALYLPRTQWLWAAPGMGATAKQARLTRLLSLTSWLLFPIASGVILSIWVGVPQMQLLVWGFAVASLLMSWPGMLRSRKENAADERRTRQVLTQLGIPQPEHCDLFRHRVPVETPEGRTLPCNSLFALDDARLAQQMRQMGA